MPRNWTERLVMGSILLGSASLSIAAYVNDDGAIIGYIIGGYVGG